MKLLLFEYYRAIYTNLFRLILIFIIILTLLDKYLYYEQKNRDLTYQRV